MKKAIALSIAILLTATMLFGCGGNDKGTKSAIANISVQETFIGVLAREVDNQANDVGGVEHLAYTSPIQNDFLFIESRLVDYVGEDAFKEWTHAQAANGTYEYTVNVLGYIKQFNITKEQFTQTCNVVPDLPLYTQEQIDCLYDSDIESMLKYVKNAGAVYSNGKLYSAEWMNCSSVEDYLAEDINIDEIKQALVDTTSAIESFSSEKNRTALSYEDKVNEYAALAS